MKDNANTTIEPCGNSESTESFKWAWLISELKAGAEAPESEFVDLNAEALLDKVKKKRRLKLGSRD